MQSIPAQIESSCGHRFGPLHCKGALRSLKHPWRSSSHQQHGRGSFTRCQVSSTSSQPVILIECDGVFVDLHDHGHRVAFNKAFQDLGLECANWSPQIYYDLRRGGDGTAEGMLEAFFNTVGWPMAVATHEQNDFTASVHSRKQKILKALVKSGEIPLRDGVKHFVEEALESGAKVGAICGTLSLEDDGVWASVSQALGPKVANNIQHFPWKQEKIGDPSEPETLVGSLQSGIDEVKRQEAKAFVDTVMSREDGIGMGIDPSILIGKRSGMTAAWMSAVLAMMGGDGNQSVTIAANGPTVDAAAAAGSISVAVPAGLSRRGAFPAAEASFEGMGKGSGLTWNRVEALMSKRASA